MLSAGGFKINDELRQAGVAVLAQRRAAAQHEEPVRAVRVGGPQLGAGDFPAAVHPLGAGAHRGQIRAAARLAHADGEEHLAADQFGQEELLLFFGAVAQQGRAGLAVADPVRGHRRARGQQLFGNDVALQRRAAMPAVFARQGHTQPAARGQAAAEIRIEAAQPVVAAGRETAGRLLLAQEGAHLRA